MFKRWGSLFREPDSILLAWLTVQSAIGWVSPTGWWDAPILWVGTITVLLAFGFMNGKPSLWKRMEPYRRYLLLACLILYTFQIWLDGEAFTQLGILHAVTNIASATLYLEPLLIMLVTLCCSPLIAALLYEVPPHEATLMALFLVLMVVTQLMVCQVSRKKAALIRKLEQDQSFEQLGRQQHLATIGQIAASIAHDIRNPLTSISGFVQLIEKNEERENYLEYYNIIRSEIGRIDSLIREVLMLSKSHTVDTAAWQQVELFVLLRRIATLLEPDAIRSNIEIVLIDKASPIVTASEEKLTQVFLNVLRNALEAVQSDGRIEIELSKDHLEAFVRIRDTGPGIPEDKLDHLFTPFYTTKAEGTGLGLSICHSIIRSYGGSIDARNLKAGGAEFIIALPFDGMKSLSD